ncbi:Transcriptional regulator [Entomortierella beljakovae]|nr:Transcriptional regulator [Entomortierella beljakovae]
MDSNASSSIDPNALTFRNYIRPTQQQPSSSPSISSSVIPPYQELTALQQELQYLAEKANIKFEKYKGELSKLDGSSLAQSKDSSVSSTPNSSVSATGYNGGSGGGNASASAARSSASPNTSSPSSFSNSSRAAGGLSGAQAQGSGTGSPSIVKPGVITLKLKRSDAAESSKTDDEQSSSTPNTNKNRTGTPKLVQDGFVKKKRKRDFDDDSEYSEEDRAALPKSKRSDDYLLGKTGRSMSPQPTKLNNNRHSTPKATQNRMGDKGNPPSSYQKKKKNEMQNEKSQKPTPKSQEVQEDFSKVKVANQVAIQTFWASMDPFFRPFLESDRTVLEEDGDTVTPLLIPPLGRHYLDVWAEEDRALLPFDGFESRRSSVDLPKDPALSRNTVYNQPFELTEENIDQDEVSCGPLTERIICSLIAEDVVEPNEIKQDEEQETPSTSTETANQSNTRNYAELEERIKRELRYIGLLGNEEIDWDAREDDEISITLRSLQKELRDVMKVNKSRKQRLLGLVNNHLAYQEYNTILDDLDKQVEQGYLKRFRMTKSKKKKTSTPKSLSENALSAMDRRRRFVQGVGPIFPAENYTIPTKSIYQEELEPKQNIGAPQTYRQLNGLP